MARPKHTRLAAARARRLRNEMTNAEARLWSGIRRKAAGARFRRQVPIGPWIVDFASFDPKLVIEVDDPSHDWLDESARTAFLEAAGFAVLRFSNAEARGGARLHLNSRTLGGGAPRHRPAT